MDLSSESVILNAFRAAGRSIIVRSLGSVPYQSTQEAMRDFVARATDCTDEEIWLLQHPQTYTRGTACEQETLMPSTIPIIESDRGGQITYHGPGQIVLYPLLSLRRNGLSVKGLVETLEQSVIDLLAEYQIEAQRRDGAPGVYVNDHKIAALGLRIRRGWCYHGLSLNVDMDLDPFKNIDPCGFTGLQVTQMSDLISGEPLDASRVGQNLVDRFCSLLPTSE